ncbi:MAG: hypothetical protein ACI3XY_07635 [Butyricicoccaceae bacterium]
MTYYTKSGVVEFSGMSHYVGYKFDGIFEEDTFDVKDAALSVGVAEVSVNVPADYDCSVSVEGLETTYADGKLTFPADAAKGQYTATLTDASGKYVSLSDTFELTVAEMPAVYD